MDSSKGIWYGAVLIGRSEGSEGRKCVWMSMRNKYEYKLIELERTDFTLTSKGIWILLVFDPALGCSSQTAQIAYMHP